MKIEDLDYNNRPRERLIEFGSRALSDVELLAIMLGSGIKNEGVYEMALRILKSYSFKELSELSYEEMTNIPGIKKAKACKLLASFEIARRSIRSDTKESLTDSKQIYEYLYDEFYFEKKEIIAVVYIDCKLRPIKKRIYRLGNVSNVAIPVKQIVEEAIINKAYGVIISHNHPSGDVNPSNSDIYATMELKELLICLDIILVEHIIIGHDNFYSFVENGLLGVGFE